MRTSILAGAALTGLLLVGCSHSSSAGKGTSVFKVKVGDCLVPPTAIKAEISTITVVKCSVPHTQEVFAEVTYGSGPPGATTTSSTSDTFPGAGVLMTYANGACLQKFQAYIGIDYQDSNLYYTYMLPSARSWSSNDRTIVCVITTTGQQLTASVRGSHL